MQEWSLCLGYSPLESSWLTLSQNGNTLTATADKNTEGADRKGYILITAADATIKLSVLQSAGDAIVSLIAEDAAFDREGGVLKVDVKSNKAFTATVDEAAAEWLSATHTDGFDFFTVTAKAYEGSDPRTGKIFIVAGTTTKEFTVTQTGEDIIFLPFMAKSASYREVATYEEKRGSVPFMFPDGYFNDAFHFSTANKYFRQVGYRFAGYNDYYYMEAATSTDSLFLRPTVEKALTDKGFKKNALGLYVKDDVPYSVSIAEARGSLVVTSSYAPIQDKAYPTFSQLPLKDPQMTWTADTVSANPSHGHKFTDIEKWEATKGSTYNETISTYKLPAGNPKVSDFAWYDTSKSDQDKGLICRGYWMLTDKGPKALDPKSPFISYVGELGQAREIYTKIDYAFWMAGSKTYLTKEFEALLVNEKFVHYVDQSGYSFYLRDSGKGYMDVLLFGVVAFSGVNDSEPVLDFQTFKVASEGLTIATIFNNRTKRMRLYDEIMKHFKKAPNVRIIK